MALDLVSIVLAFCYKFVKLLVSNYSVALKVHLLFPVMNYIVISDKEEKVQGLVIEFC